MTLQGAGARPFFLLLLVLLLTAFQVSAAEREGRVAWIYDGDTLEVEGVGKVRLLGIDTPEGEASERDGYFRKMGIPAGRLRQVAAEVLRFNIENVKGRIVHLTFDRERTDRHGRTLAYVTLPDGRMLNRVLLEKGYAVVYRRFDFERKAEFLKAEAAAKRKGNGIWKNP